ncbi:MAG: GTPase Era [Alphaproteobacteria bacterium]|nr:GTPase Era [Alphaproteobacteria bacterium]
MSQDERRCGFVAVLGAPNAGKSTLVNALVGAKVSIVTPKVQTTRMRILGIGLVGASQLVFVDTPGIFAAKARLERAMVAAAWAGAGEADLVLLTVDAKRGLDQTTQAIVPGLARLKPPCWLVLNKLDLVSPPSLLGLAKALNDSLPFQRTFMVSAATGDGVADLRGALAAAAPVGDWHYPADQLADLPQRLLAAELTREQLFLRLHDELPYACFVETEAWQERRDGGVRIEQTVYVRRPGQRAIVLGEGGRTIKQIGARARAALAGQLGRPVHLFLHVKLRENWPEERGPYRALGLDYEA